MSSYNNVDDYQNVRKSVIITPPVKLVDATGILDEDEIPDDNQGIIGMPMGITSAATIITTKNAEFTNSNMDDGGGGCSDDGGGGGSGSGNGNVDGNSTMEEMLQHQQQTRHASNESHSYKTQILNGKSVLIKPIQFTKGSDSSGIPYKVQKNEGANVYDEYKKKITNTGEYKVPEVNNDTTTIAGGGGASASKSAVAQHYNNIEEVGQKKRMQSRIYYLRNFNNWIKSMFINEYIQKVKDNMKVGAPIRILDMCCGKGGDLMKWEHANVHHVICTDIADVSMVQCKERYDHLFEQHQRGRNKFTKMFTSEFITSDSTMNRIRQKFKDPSIELNLVSCQFAFHYCFESLNQAECMLRNAAECLRAGDYFIGTIPDAYEIMKRQRLLNKNEFGNDIYNITFLCDTEAPPLFGAKYNFQLDGVVNCPEYLVYFPLFIKLAKKFGLELTMNEGFATYYKRMLEHGKGLMERMPALETYPPLPNSEHNFNAENYEHAANYFSSKKKVSSGHNAEQFTRCGTLSKSEWEVATLYLVFAFKKMKKLVNAKGEVEFYND